LVSIFHIWAPIYWIWDYFHDKVFGLIAHKGIERSLFVGVKDRNLAFGQDISLLGHVKKHHMLGHVLAFGLVLVLISFSEC